MRKGLLVFSLTLGLSAPSARADVKPHALFTDGLVLQQGANCPVWGTASPGEKVTVTLTRDGGNVTSGTTTADAKDGTWKVGVASGKAGGPFTLTFKGNNEITLKEVYVGEVWVASGQSNMEWSVNASADPAGVKKNSRNPKIRLFTVPKRTSDTPQRDLNARWVACGPDTVGPFSAVAYHFGKHLQKELDVPIGLINCSWGGTRAEAWTSRPVLEADPQYKGEFPAQVKAIADYPKTLAKYKDDLETHKKAVEKAKAEGAKPPAAPRAPFEPAKNPNAPSALYNGMLSSLIPYAIKGAIWYQGESNAGRAEQYRTLFPMMIENWRKDWKQGDFPFLFVQLAPFYAIEKGPTDTAWARLRDAQRHTTLTLKNTAMAVITDVGDEKDIHPAQKEPVGHRLALAALALTYGKPVEYSGPHFEKMTVEGSRAVLHFSHTGGGLVAKDGPLTGFTVAGADRKFHLAEAEIRGDTVVVSCKEVEAPVAVRFGWANYPVVNLWNKAGLPASPFRTDDWPMADAKPRN